MFFKTAAYGLENFYDQAVDKFNDKKFDESKFLFHRNIVFNPTDAKSYLYLAKIFNSEKNQKEEEKNLNTTLLLEPNNEEAIYMLTQISLDKSNFSKANELLAKLNIVCKKFCSKKKEIEKTLQNLEAKNEKNQ
ncbi:MAG: tetratricopeptide repeat protein [Candidatus Pelagibacter sp.]